MVKFVDATTSGERHDAGHLEIFEERVTLRELIRRRVFQEVAEFNARPAEVFHGLVQPDGTDRFARGVRMRGAGQADSEEHVGRALEAFGRNGFVVLVGDRQVESLDDELQLRMGSEITFLQLVPLVGG